MSRHTYESKIASNEEVVVIAGWDRTTDCFFLTVEKSNHENPIYDNLLDKNGSFKHRNDFSYYQKVLDDLDIQLPDGFVHEIEKDKKNNIGNKFVAW